MIIDPTWLNHLEIQIGELLFDELTGLIVVVTGFNWQKKASVICRQVDRNERHPNFGEEWHCHGSFLRRFTIEGE